jgi:hypothetical protein
MANLPPRPNAQPNQEFQDLLQQGKMRLAGDLATGPSEGRQFADFASLVGAGFQGGNEFRAARGQQDNLKLAQDEQLRQILAHQDNLSVAQAQEQRLVLKQIQDQALAEGNFAAGIIEQYAQGSANDRAILTQRWIGTLNEAGVDNLDPRQVQQALAGIFQELQASGQLEGPPPETVMGSPGAQLLDKATGQPVGDAVPRESLDRLQAKQDIETEAKLKIEREKAKLASKAGNAKPDNYQLPDGRTVLSYDHKTYIDPDTGQIGALPSDSVRLGRETAAAETRIGKARAEAEKEVVGALQPQTKTMVSAALEGGVGPWSNLAAGIDAVVGGLGVNEALGYKGSLFPETAKNRTYLRALRQLGKAAFVNNPRFPIAEQQLVNDLLPDPDTFWQNPGTTANEVVELRTVLNGWKAANNEIIATAPLDPKTLGELVAKNAEIDRFLSLMGAGSAELRTEAPEIGTVEDGYRFKGGDPSNPDNWEEE